MWTKRIKDIAAKLSIGDGALTLIGPRARPGMALRAPGAARDHQLADHPGLMRLEGAASITLGVLLAWRHYRESPRSWVSVAVGRMAERQG
jgi:hypothetical protein